MVCRTTVVEKSWGECLIAGRKEILFRLALHRSDPSTNYKQVLIQTLKQATARVGNQPKTAYLQPSVIPDRFLIRPGFLPNARALLFLPPLLAPSLP